MTAQQAADAGQSVYQVNPHKPGTPEYATFLHDYFVRLRQIAVSSDGGLHNVTVAVQQ